MWDEIASKTVEGNGNKTPSDVRPVGNTNENPQNFSEIIPVQKEVMSNPSQRNGQNQLSLPSFSHRKIHI